MSATLFKQGIKSNWKLATIFAAIMLLYMTMIVSMFNPETQASLQKMMETMPKEMFTAFGFSLESTTSLNSFLASYYYGFIIVMFPMIFVIMLANKLIAKLVDRGSMAYLLSTPTGRVKIAFTQAGFILFSTFVLLLFVTLAGMGICEAMFPGKLDIGAFLLMNLGAFAMFLAISGISFCCSAIFNDAKMSLAFGAGIPIAFFVIDMLANVGDKFSWLKYFTLFTLFDAGKIAAGDTWTIPFMLILAAIGVAAYAAGVVVFNKKDLPL